MANSHSSRCDDVITSDPANHDNTDALNNVEIALSLSLAALRSILRAKCTNVMAAFRI